MVKRQYCCVSFMSSLSELSFCMTYIIFSVLLALILIPSWLIGMAKLKTGLGILFSKFYSLSIFSGSFPFLGLSNP